MVVPSKGPTYILLKDTVGLKKPRRRIGVRFGSQTLFTACAGGVYLANKDDKQPQDKTMISLSSLTDTKRILVTPRENTRQLAPAELNMLLPIASAERRVKVLTSEIFSDLVTTQIDDVIAINDGDVQSNATVRYVGQLPWKQEGVYLGVEFEEPIGDNNGCYLFEAEEKCAKFVTIDTVDKFVLKTERTRYALPEDVVKPNNNTISKKISKRMSFPFPPTFSKRIKPRLRSKSVQDLSERDNPPQLEQLSEIKKSMDEILESDNSLTLCPNEGCDLKVEIGRAKIHQEVCPFALTKCSNDGCDLELSRRDIDEHTTRVCDYAIVNCANDGCQVTVLRKMMNKHLSICLHETVECANEGCEQETYEQMNSSQLNKNGGGQCFWVNCPAPNCSFKGPGSELCEHIGHQHYELLMKHLEDIRRVFAGGKSGAAVVDNKYSDDEDHVYHAPCINAFSESDDNDTEYLTPCAPDISAGEEEQIYSNDKHVYLTPFSDVSMEKDGDGYEYLSLNIKGV